MGDSSSTSPEYGFRPSSELPPAPRVQLRPRRRSVHLVLFLLTIGSTLVVGADHFAGFYGDFGTRTVDLSGTTLLLSGLWYSASILAILRDAYDVATDLHVELNQLWFDVDEELHAVEIVEIPFVVVATANRASRT